MSQRRLVDPERLVSPVKSECTLLLLVNLVPASFFLFSDKEVEFQTPNTCT